MHLIRCLALLLMASILAPVAAAAAPPLTRVTFYTDWKAQAEHGGFYQAQALGLYRKAGLDVTLRAGGPQTDNTRLLAAQAIDLALVSNAFQAALLAQRKADVSMVMAVFQKDPQVIMAHGRGPPPPLRQWNRRPLFMDDAFRISYFPWLKARYGFTDRQVRPYAFSLTPWLQAPGALQEGYLSSEPFTAQKAGAATQVLVLADAGFAGYGAMVAATGSIIRTRPDVVRAFVAATQAGWASYLAGDPAPGNALIRRDNPEMTEALLTYGRRQLVARGIVQSGDARTHGVGIMTAARWQHFTREMAALGVVPQGLDARTIYDLRFLPDAGHVADGR